MVLIIGCAERSHLDNIGPLLENVRQTKSNSSNIRSDAGRGDNSPERASHHHFFGGSFPHDEDIHQFRLPRVVLSVIIKQLSRRTREAKDLRMWRGGRGRMGYVKANTQRIV